MSHKVLTPNGTSYTVLSPRDSLRLYAQTRPKQPSRRQLHAARQHYPADLRDPYRWWLFADWGAGEGETSAVMAPAWRCSRCDRVLGPRAAEDTRPGGGPSYDKLLRQPAWLIGGSRPWCCGYPVPGVEYLMMGFEILWSTPMHARFTVSQAGSRLSAAAGAAAPPAGPASPSPAD
jgi:hypothetical protein